MNSPVMRDTVVNDNKRYLRFSRSHAHPTWLGFQDRYLFPAYEPEPSFFFIRKLNILGGLYEEKKLIEWIQTHHFNSPLHTECTLDDASVVASCLKLYTDKVAKDGEIIVIPTNKGFINTANNLVCSLNHFGIKHIIYWALDHATHDSLLKQGHVSILFPGFPTEEDSVLANDKFFTKMMRYKPRLLRMLLKAGHSVWYLDADAIALSDFTTVVRNDTDANVFVSLHGIKPATSVMYFRQSTDAVEFVERMELGLKISGSYDDEKALRWMMRDTAHIEFITPYNTSALPLKNNTHIPDFPIEKRQLSVIKVKALDPDLFPSDLFVDNVPVSATIGIPLLIHSPDLTNVEVVLQEWGLWYMSSGECKWTDSVDSVLAKIGKKVRK